jgi:hypothetical protein
MYCERGVEGSFVPEYFTNGNGKKTVLEDKVSCATAK